MIQSTSPALAEEIVVPGSVANLGGGFDTLGVAVQLFLRVRIDRRLHDGGTNWWCARARRRSPERTPSNGRSTYLRSAWARRAPSVVVDVESDIPMAAGLGSSAAATVAGLRVFERVTGAVPDDVLLSVAAEAEGHADNAAPALFGGLTSVVGGVGPVPALQMARGPKNYVWSWRRRPLVSRRRRPARRCPTMLPRKDAIFNLQRVLSLVHALQSDDDAHLREAVQDRWHQPARAALVPLLARGARLSRIPTCSAHSCRAPDRRLPCSHGGSSHASSSCSRRCMRAPGARSRFGHWPCITLLRWPARCRLHGRTV